ALLNIDALGIREAAVEDFALVGKLDYQSSLFRPFADPRYNNFSKLRIWNHRKIELPEQPDSLPSGLDVVAFLDSGDPWIVQQDLERGNIWLLAAGWQPTSSTFALSSKFLPILLGMLDPRGNTRVQDWTYEVGESIAVEEEVLEILDAEGTRVTEEVARLGPSQVVFSEPGIYQLVSAERQRRVSIRIPFSESKLDAQDSEVFEQYGVQLGRTVTDTERRESARQLKVEELEGKQKLWQWLLAAGIVILIAETFLGGWTARRAARQLATS
ncbi:MAG: hypothetical protein NXI32_23760, partial [bacterium]|nr:hypothetical protein [bacterium]